MNAYELKVQARLERLRARAEKKRQEAERAFGSARQIANGMPMGQPILVGHHSEKRHRRDIARIDSGMRRGCEATEAAEDLERRARAAEKNRAVSSDDPDAVVKLKAKLADLERARAHMVEVNTTIRTAKRAWDKDPDKAQKLWTTGAIAALVDMGVAERAAAELVKPDFMGRIGYANYQLTNTGSEARRVRQRIAALQAQQTTAPPEPEHYGELRVEEEDNRVRIYFPGKPAADVRAHLKSRGFRFSYTEGAWQRHAGGQAWYEAREIAKRYGGPREPAQEAS